MLAKTCRSALTGLWENRSVDPIEVIFWLLVLGGPALVIAIVAINVRKSRRRLVVWWMSASFALGLSIWFTASAVTEARKMQARTSCVLRPLDFDNDSVETVRVQWWPPRVQCEYGYSYTNQQEVVWESRWLIYLPVIFIPVALATALGAIRNTRLRRRAVAPDGADTVTHAELPTDAGPVGG